MHGNTQGRVRILDSASSTSECRNPVATVAGWTISTHGGRNLFASVAQLADAQVLGTCVFGRVGSNPTGCTSMMAAVRRCSALMNTIVVWVGPVAAVIEGVHAPSGDCAGYGSSSRDGIGIHAVIAYIFLYQSVYSNR